MQNYLVWQAGHDQAPRPASFLFIHVFTSGNKCGQFRRLICGCVRLDHKPDGKNAVFVRFVVAFDILCFVGNRNRRDKSAGGLFGAKTCTVVYVLMFVHGNNNLRFAPRQAVRPGGARDQKIYIAEVRLVTAYNRPVFHPFKSIPEQP